jgi:hypothetical protein
MAIQFDYTTPSTGAVASYHVVQQIGLDYASNRTHVSIASYVSKEAYSAGKFPVFIQSIDMDGLPAVNSDPLVTVQSALIAAPPTDGTASNTPNRYLFAGASAVA